MKTFLRGRKSFLFHVLVVSVMVAAVSTRADEVHLKMLSSGAMPKLGGYMPQKLELSSAKPDSLKKAPADLAAPLYGELKLGPADSPATFVVILDEPEGKPSHLYVDANANGDLTDDSVAEWTPHTNKGKDGVEYTMYMGGANMKMHFGEETADLHIAMYRFDKHDPMRTNFGTIMFYYGDYARTGEIKLGSESYPVLLPDRMTMGDFRGGKKPGPPAVLMIDVNRDGKFDRRESFPLDKPFNIGGTTYEISGITASGASFQVNKSDKTVEETKPMIALSAGKQSLPFEGKTTAGDAVKFPETYKGKLVLLDFWATWCGPCVGELPHLTAAYEKLHSQGFEVLGVSLDQPNNGPKLASFTKDHNMPWAQIYDGKFWQAEIAQKYYIESIPHAFLVDGDSGTIVAEGESLRGDELAKTLESALAKKNGK
jgi:thiol-disulfide isomerase/thioredoxin